MSTVVKVVLVVVILVDHQFSSCVIHRAVEWTHKQNLVGVDLAKIDLGKQKKIILDWVYQARLNSLVHWS
mgnify:CR=1 FL=1